MQKYQKCSLHYIDFNLILQMAFDYQQQLTTIRERLRHKDSDGGVLWSCGQFGTQCYYLDHCKCVKHLADFFQRSIDKVIMSFFHNLVIHFGFDRLMLYSNQPTVNGTPLT
jgi:hypothetical protein